MACPGVRFNPFDGAFRDDPYAVYRRLLREAPIFRVDGCLGADWIITSHRLIETILQDDRFTTDDLPRRIRERARAADAAESVASLCDAISSWLFFMNGRAHAMSRRRLAKGFTTEIIEALRGDIKAVAVALASAAMRRGRIDIVSELARPLSARAATLLLGWRDADCELVARWANDIFSVFAQPLPLLRYKAIDARMRVLGAALLPVLAAAGAQQAGLMPLLARLSEEGALSQAEALAVATMMLSVGQDTTQSLVGNAVNALLAHPDKLAELQRERGLLPRAVQELARFDAPVQLVLRVASEDVECDGKTVRAGDRVHLFLGAGLHDPEAIAEPDRLDWRRSATELLPFGAGAHFCLGWRLAFITTEAALSALLPDLDRWKPVDTGRRWARAPHMRSLDALPLVYDPAGLETAGPPQAS
jgi:cytochrome P450